MGQAQGPGYPARERSEEVDAAQKDGRMQQCPRAGKDKDGRRDPEEGLTQVTASYALRA